MNSNYFIFFWFEFHHMLSNDSLSHIYNNDNNNYNNNQVSRKTSQKI